MKKNKAVLFYSEHTTKGIITSYMMLFWLTETYLISTRNHEQEDF
jgi:hypothetical protein